MEDVFNLDDKEFTLLICRNLESREISTLLNEKMWANPLIYHEVLMNAPIEKFHDFNEDTMFFQFVIGLDPTNVGRRVTIQFVKWDWFGLLFLRDVWDGIFEIEDKLIMEHDFVAKPAQGSEAHISAAEAALTQQQRTKTEDNKETEDEYYHKKF